jgi:hypothetical protein
MRTVEARQSGRGQGAKAAGVGAMKKGLSFISNRQLRKEGTLNGRAAPPQLLCLIPFVPANIVCVVPVENRKSVGRYALAGVGASRSCSRVGAGVRACGRGCICGLAGARG